MLPSVFSQQELMMKITRRTLTFAGLSLLAGTAFSPAFAEFGEGGLHIGEDLEDFWIATDAYI